jgi:putative nucleotidyltransferase with HDIG domain
VNRADELLKKMGALPPLPGTAVKLIGLLNDPRSSVQDMVEVIKYDQAVTGQVLRLCNSAFFGLPRAVTSLHDAMSALGMVKVLQVVMAVHTNTMLYRKQIGYGLERGMLWKHSVAVALAASEIGQRVDEGKVNLLFTAALLHDIGKVVLNEYVAADFLEIVRRVNMERISFVEAENRVLGYSHAEIGGKVAEMWRLPEPIVRCVRHHHDPDGLGSPDELVDVVYLANCLCRFLGIGIGEESSTAGADEAVLRRRGFEPGDMEEIGARTLAGLKRVEEMFAGAAEQPAEAAGG